LFDHRFVLRCDLTDMPLAKQPYRLRWKDQVIEGVTDEKGQTSAIPTGSSAAEVTCEILGKQSMANGPALRVITTQKSQSTVKSDTTPAQAQGNELAMALQGMEAASAAFAESIIKDPSARADYTRKTAAARAELIQLVKEGKITPHEAARTANAIRNQIMELTRAKLTDFGLALSKDMKASGRPLDYMQSLKANEMFGRPFESLTSVQKEKVWVQIVESAGKSNHGVNMRVKLYGAAGRVFGGDPRVRRLQRCHC
jgi:hypothetical protein